MNKRFVLQLKLRTFLAKVFIPRFDDIVFNSSAFIFAVVIKAEMEELSSASKIVSNCDETRRKKFNLKFLIRAEICGAYLVFLCFALVFPLAF